MNNLLQRTPPNNNSTETSVLSALFIDNRGFEDIDGLRPEDFYFGCNKTIFECMLNLKKQNIPVDLTTVTQQMKTDETLESVGGVKYIVQICDSAPVATNIRAYAHKLIALTQAREMIIVASRIVDKGYRATDIEDYISESQANVLGVQTTLTKDNFVGMEQLMLEAVERIEKAQTSEHQIGLRFGMPKLDQYMQIWGSKLILLAGRPGMGKTALAVSIAVNLAFQGHKVGFLSIEMDSHQLADRMLSAESNINSMIFYANNSIGTKGMQTLNDSADLLSQLPILFDDSECGLEDIKRKCRKFKKEGCELVIVDQLSQISYEKGLKPYIGISKNCTAIKQLTKELKTPILLLTQLNRELEKRADKRPIMSDLAETGKLEQDADIIAFLYREGVYDKNVDESVTEIILEKNRQGEKGVERRVLFNKKRGSFKLIP